MKVDPASLLLPGPWEHTYVAANGHRFHVALAGPDLDETPLVVLLHDFPQLWYSWRAQIPALAEAGYRVAAVDLRGFGASDKPATGHTVPDLAADIAGVIRSLGAEKAVIVGHGHGGQVAWAMPALAPECTRAIATLAAPHPAALRDRLRSTLTPVRLPEALRLAAPWIPERRLRKDGVARILRAWSAPGWTCDALGVYTDAMRLPAAAPRALEQVRWQLQATRRPDGRAYLDAVRAPVRVPTLGLHGDLDRLFGVSTRRRDAEYVAGAYRGAVIRGAGHFLPEEAPDAVTNHLLEFLASVD